MPELPDLEAIRAVLNRSILGVPIASAEVLRPIPIRQPALSEFTAILKGNQVREVARRGKFLLFQLASPHLLAMNFMLTGHLQLCPPKERRRAKTCFILHLEDGRQLRYVDDQLMGKVYVAERELMDLIPGFSEMGPEALSEEVTLEVFRERIRRHPGQIKNILVNDHFLAGIGNAYADEVLFAAGVYPYKRRPALAPEQVEALYGAMHAVLEEACPIVAQRMGEEIHLKVRDFLQVHGKGGHPCPRCGNRISQITANQRLTNFCRRCQT